MTFKMFVFGLSCAFIVSACTSSSDPSGNGQIVMQTEFSSSTIKPSMAKIGDETQGFADVDSIRIDSVRILLSRIKLHRADEDTNEGSGKDVKTGPALIIWARGGVRTAFSESIPSGNYSRVKLEMHKFSGSEAKTYENHPVFGEFATDKDRVTLIVNGTSWKDGVSTSFSLSSDRTENLWITFEPYFTVAESSPTTIVLDFDPVAIFRVGGRLRNPLDAAVRLSLDSNLKNIFRLRKK